MAWELDTAVSTWLTGYRERHEANYELIESALNQLLDSLQIATGATGAEVPLGLREIFDRNGLIGAGSYDFDEGTLTGPNYNLTVAAGAFWTGVYFKKQATQTLLSLAAKSTGTYYLNVDTAGVPSIAETAVAGATVRSFDWNATTHVVSAKAIYAGVAILFDGDDYADMLTSTVLSTTYTSVAARLEAIESSGSSDPFAGYYAQDLPHSGLNFQYQAGLVRNDSVLSETVAGQVALTDDATNYVEVDPADGAVSKNTVGFTSGLVPLYVVVTASGAIDTVTDRRTAAIAGTGGGGGGHTQGTDLGTTASQFLIDTDATGSPADRAGLQVENGSLANAFWVFNRSTGKWEFSTDGGSSYHEVPSVVDLLGALEFSKYVGLEDPVSVHAETGRNSSSAWETIDLSSYLTDAPNGVAGAALVIFFSDSSPGPGVGVNFRKGGSTAEPLYGYNVWSGADQPHLRVIPVSADSEVEFWVEASGAGTANLRVVLIGYFAKIVGVGTAHRVFTHTGLNVSAGSSATFNLTAWLNRGLVHKLEMTETGGSLAGTWDVEVYAKDTFLAADLLYQAENINPTANPIDFEDFLPWWAVDDDLTSELHLKIINHDSSNAGVFSITLKAEQFA